MKLHALIWHLCSLLGKHGFFQHKGSWNEPTKRTYPAARVIYPDGVLSPVMPIGNAWNVARANGGVVVPPDLRF